MIKHIKKHKHHFINLGLISMLAGFIFISIIIIWVATLKVPDFRSFDERKIARSTKIYDKEGEVVLYDIHQDIKRTVIPFEEMGENIKEATVAIEDDNFYEHKGVQLKSIFRAVLVNLQSGSFSQGGSTITQQIVKNSLLTTDKKVSRKIKEVFLALKIERELTKDEILEIYLNESPYGGSLYGIQEASMAFFAKNPKDLSIAEAAYLAAMPQAPTRYSPYGQNLDKLEARKNIVLEKMLKLGFISEEEYEQAKMELVTFQPQDRWGIKAPHFVFYVREYLEDKYGKDVVESGGLKVTTTLDAELQQKAEEIVLKHALENEKNFKASNASLVAIDPTNGQIISMVGSRDYFDKNIDGKFNVALAKRQPGSAFKPFIYATAMEKGFTPNTVLFDVKTEFQSTCDPYGKPITGSADKCYSPSNYDDEYVGPISLRNALAQSRNVPAVQLLYLTKIEDSLKTAKNMGIKTLGDGNIYGLTLVLGGGEVTLLDMVSSYGVFATEGVRFEPQAILKVEDANGNVLEEFKPIGGNRIISENSARIISDILSDNEARTPLFGVNSFMNFGNIDVAGKTGTTNNNKDAWMLGYNPNIVVGVWSGNNDNSPMTKGSAISGRLWREFMDEALKKTKKDSFTEPFINDSSDLKPVFRGLWQGGESVFIDTISKKLATEYTPEETKKELILGDIKTTLYWIDRNDPMGEAPGEQSNQTYINWQTAVEDWWNKNKNKYEIVQENDIPTEYDDVHTEEKIPFIEIENPTEDIFYSVNDPIDVSLDYETFYDVKSFDIFINDIYIVTKQGEDFDFSFIPKDLEVLNETNELRIIIRDKFYNRNEDIVNFKIAF